VIAKRRLLSGGNINVDGIARNKNTIIRHQDHAWPEAVSQSLAIVRDRGFRHSPYEVERIDANCVILSWGRGRSLPDPVPRWAATYKALARVTDFIAAATEAGHGIGFLIDKHDWFTPAMPGVDFIHGDPHPGNVTFDRLHRPVGLIDFELATIGSSLTALASVLFSWGPLEPIALTPWRGRLDTGTLASRMQTVIRRWPGPIDRDDLLEATQVFLRWRTSWISSLAGLGNAAADSLANSPSLELQCACALAVLKDLLWSQESPLLCTRSDV
jgi:hypothetical protein